MIKNILKRFHIKSTIFLIIKAFERLKDITSGENEIPEISLPTCYNIDTPVIPEWISDDVKLQAKVITQKNPKLLNRVRKSGKLVVKFETNIRNFSWIYKNRAIYLYLLDGEFLNLDMSSDNLIWKRNQILSNLIDS